MNAHSPGVVFFAPDFSGYTSRLLDGVQRYQGENGLRLRDQRASLQALRNIGGAPPWTPDVTDGVVSYLGKEEGVEEWLGRAEVPVVNCTADLSDTIPSVFTDCDALVSMAFEHLQECETDDYAMITAADSRVAKHREELFAQRVADAGGTLHVHHHTLRFSPAIDVMQAHREDPGLRDFLADIPKPTAIFCQNDFVTGTVFDMLDSLNLVAGSDVFLLGIYGQFCRSRMITAVEQSGADVGYAAAAMLHSLASNQKVTKPDPISPRGIIAGDTTVPREMQRFEDAIHTIEKHACEGLTVDELIAAQAISRKTFERYFQKQYQCAPGELIRRKRFERSKELLCATDLSIRRIGQMVGFSRNSAFTIFFRKQAEMSPREFRVACEEARS